MDRKEQQIKGKITSGMGQGAFFTQLDWVRQQCQNKLGFIPYGGTLNIVVDKDSLSAAASLRQEKGVDIISSTPGYCPARAIPVDINGRPAAVILPEAKDYTAKVHGEDTLEIIAPVLLKEALAKGDGDEVTISFTGKEAI